MANKRMNIVNKRYGKLRVIEYASSKGASGHTYWLCQCDCGNTKVIRGSHLKDGNTKSCGCLIKETNHARLWKGNYIKDGYRWLSVSGGRDVAEHRVVAEQTLKRKLAKEEVVHHINGNKLDNRPKNLRVMMAGKHISLHRKNGRKSKCA